MKKMKLRKKRGKYRRQSVTIKEVLAALERWDIEIIYSWGAFCLHGLACKVGDIAFRFDYDVNPMYSIARYLAEHSEAEVAEKIVKELNGHGRLPKTIRKKCIEFLSQAQQNKKAGC